MNNQNSYTSQQIVLAIIYGLSAICVFYVLYIAWFRDYEDFELSILTIDFIKILGVSLVSYWTRNLVGQSSIRETHPGNRTSTNQQGIVIIAIVALVIIAAMFFYSVNNSNNQIVSGESTTTPTPDSSSTSIASSFTPTFLSPSSTPTFLSPSSLTPSSTPTFLSPSSLTPSSTPTFLSPSSLTPSSTTPPNSTPRLAIQNGSESIIPYLHPWNDCPDDANSKVIKISLNIEGYDDGELLWHRHFYESDDFPVTFRWCGGSGLYDLKFTYLDHDKYQNCDKKSPVRREHIDAFEYELNGAELGTGCPGIWLLEVSDDQNSQSDQFEFIFQVDVIGDGEPVIDVTPPPATPPLVATPLPSVTPAELRSTIEPAMTVTINYLTDNNND